MQQGMSLDRSSSINPLDGKTADHFVETHYRKTEIRERYQHHDAADRVSKLMRVIEKDVIPHLVQARQKAVEEPRPSRDSGEEDAARVIRFARLLLGHDTQTSTSSFVADLRAEGFSIEHIYLHLLAPAARHVGTLWDDDLCTFVDVTLALGTLHRLVLDLSAHFRTEPLKLDWARRVLLVPPAQDSHTLGLLMVAEFFRRGAWTVDMAASRTDDALGDAVQAEWFTVVGFSAACDQNLDHLAETIRIVRQRSCNPAVGVLVGGPAFIGHPEYVARIGADGMAIDAIQAVLEAERFVFCSA